MIRALHFKGNSRSLDDVLRKIGPVGKELILNHHERNWNCTRALPADMLSETDQEEMLIKKGFPHLQVLGSTIKPPRGL